MSTAVWSKSLICLARRRPHARLGSVSLYLPPSPEAKAGSLCFQVFDICSQVANTTWLR
jgi:hypothetical protein